MPWGELVSLRRPGSLCSAVVNSVTPGGPFHYPAWVQKALDRSIQDPSLVFPQFYTLRGFTH